MILTVLKLHLPKGSFSFENCQNHSYLLITNCTRGRAISYTYFYAYFPQSTLQFLILFGLLLTIQTRLYFVISFILLEAKRKCCGLPSGLATDDYPSAISARFKMAVVVSISIISFVPYLLGQTNSLFLFTVNGKPYEHSQIFQNHSNDSVEIKKTVRFKSTTLNLFRCISLLLETANFIYLFYFVSRLKEK